MDYKIIEKDGKIIIENLQDFELSHIFECGQCFRWNKEADGSYTGVAQGRVLNVQKKENQIIFAPTTKDDFMNIWRKYFDLDRDYGEIKKKLAENDDVMEKAIAHGYGIRILNQDVWETLISFIISSNRGIQMIKRSIESLSERYGTFLGIYKGRKYYDFPTAEALFNKSIEEIRKSHTGYRTKYIVDAAAVVVEKQINLCNLKNVSTDDARKQLIRLRGVGPKVSDCILLFSMEKTDAFPIDVWVKRVMEYFYVPQGTGLNEIQDFAQKKFDGYAGFAQQYLFYYARELGIGK